MAKNGLETTICHENQSLFKNEQTIIDNNEFNLVMDEYKEYLKYAENFDAKVVKGLNITVNALKQKLQDGNLVILTGEIPN